jgi:hypothetical protein
MGQRKKRTDGDLLRRRAEQRLRDHPASASVPMAGDLIKLVYELEVHQVELEIQNQELTRSGASSKRR